MSENVGVSEEEAEGKADGHDDEEGEESLHPEGCVFTLEGSF